MDDPRKALETRPKHVALVALGPSYYDFIREAVGRINHAVPFDEIWTVNRGFQAVRHDKVFVMDDLRWLEQRDHGYAEALKRHDKPLITCFAYDDYPMSVAYPIDMVVKRLEDDLLNNTVAYAIAYAMMTKVECLSIYGADFYYPDVQMREEGSQACAFLLGVARSFGMRFRLPQSTTLLGAHKVKIDPKTGKACRPLYGYHRRVELVDPPEHGFMKYIKEIQGGPDGVGRYNLTFGPREESEDARTRTLESSRLQADLRDQPGPVDVHEALSQAVLGRRPPDLREAGPAMVGGWKEGGVRPGLVPDGSGEGHVGEGAGGDGAGQGARTPGAESCHGQYSGDRGEIGHRAYPKEAYPKGDGEDKEAAQEIHPEEEIRRGLIDGE